MIQNMDRGMLEPLLARCYVIPFHFLDTEYIFEYVLSSLKLGPF